MRAKCSLESFFFLATNNENVVDPNNFSDIPFSNQQVRV